MQKLKKVLEDLAGPALMGLVIGVIFWIGA